MEELTKAHEQVMQCVWELKKAFLKDIVDQFPEPKPAYTTVSTVVRVLVKKGFLDYNTYGKVREYFPTITREEYVKKQYKNVVSSFFSGSTSKFARFFTETEDMNLTELEEMKKMIEDKIKNLKDNND